MTDIRKFAVSETKVIHLRNATDEPMVGDDGEPMTIEVYGPGSKVYRRAYLEQERRAVDRAKRGKGHIQTFEDKVDFAVACTKAFSPNIEFGDVKGEDLFRAVYANGDTGFIFDQVSGELRDWGNFTKASSTS